MSGLPEKNLDHAAMGQRVSLSDATLTREGSAQEQSRHNTPANRSAELSSLSFGSKATQHLSKQEALSHAVKSEMEQAASPKLSQMVTNRSLSQATLRRSPLPPGLRSRFLPAGGQSILDRLINFIAFLLKRLDQRLFGKSRSTLPPQPQLQQQVKSKVVPLSKLKSSLLSVNTEEEESEGLSSERELKESRSQGQGKLGGARRS